MEGKRSLDSSQAGCSGQIGAIADLDDDGTQCLELCHRTPGEAAVL